MGKATLICIFLAAIAAGASGPRLAWGSPATPALMGEVLAALDKGDAQHAARLADAALQEEGVSASERGCLLLYRGLARELLGARDAALRDFTQALDTHALPPDERGQALLQRGFLRDGLGRLDGAAGDYTAVIAMKDISLATALNNRANIYRRQNRLREAQRDYLAALSVAGGKPQYSYFGLGQIAEAKQDSPAARGLYAKAVAADPNYAAAAERLTALGGPPEGAISDPGERIVLRAPPARDEVSETRQGGGIAPHVSQGQETKVALTLDPRQTKPRRRLTPVSHLVLRPALDQPGRHTSGAIGAEVQLGAWRSAAEANAGWDVAKVRAAELLKGLSHHILTADLPGKGRYFRLRVSPGEGRNGGGICASLAAKGVPCFPVRD
jgi:tetratricopeptide (TPR) repeat protein